MRTVTPPKDSPRRNTGAQTGSFPVEMNSLELASKFGRSYPAVGKVVSISMAGRPTAKGLMELFGSARREESCPVKL